MSEMDFTAPNRDGPDKTIPRFFIKAVLNEFRSTAEARRVFEDKEYVEIIVPGERGTIVEERVKDTHRERWPRAYEAFKGGQELVLEGTPIDEWPAVGPSQALEMKLSNVKTVEQLAGLSDALLSKVVPMGGHALRDKAKRFLEVASNNAPTERLAADLAEAQRESADLKRQLKELGDRFQAFKDKRDAAA